MQKEHLLAELNASLKELDKYKQNNPKLFNYLPIELKNIVAMAHDMLLPANVETKGTLEKEKPKKCKKMERNWERYIIKPFNEALPGILATGKNIYGQLTTLSQNLIEGNRNSDWFNPMNKGDKTPFNRYISLSGSTQGMIVLQKQFQRDASNQLVLIDGNPIEVPSNLSNPLPIKPGTFNLNAGDIAQFSIPVASDKKIVVGSLSYELNAFTEPDTFIIRDSVGTQFENISNAIGGKGETIPLQDIKGNLFVDVIESSPLSEWNVTINLDILVVSFILPKCYEETPCPEW
jgi:hypothetical protein